jgi:hypothetical protein
MELLQRESFWGCIVGAETFENFCQKIVPDFSFKKEVNTEVVKSFGIVRKLLIHSYFEYDFLDPAMAKSLSSFEMALKHRYFEITGTKWSGSLQRLTYYFNDNGYFEFYRKELLDALRNTRNSFAHPDKSFGGGFGLMNVFSHCVGMINDTYEDVSLREQRMTEKKRINDFLKNLIANGGMMTNETASYIIYDAAIDFINNVSSLKKYFGHFKMIFRLKYELNEKIKPTDFLFLFEAVAYEIDIECTFLKLTLADNSIITFSPIHKEINQERFDKWNSEYKASREDWVTDIGMNSFIDKQWAAARKELHLWGNFENSSERT